MKTKQYTKENIETIKNIISTAVVNGFKTEEAQASLLNKSGVRTARGLEWNTMRLNSFKGCYLKSSTQKATTKSFYQKQANLVSKDFISSLISNHTLSETEKLKLVAAYVS